MMEIISKYKIRFRNICFADDKLIEKIRQWRNSEKVSLYMLNNHYITKEEHQRWIEKLKKSEDVKVWVIHVNNFPIGTVYLENIDYENRNTNWGFYIGEISYRGKGVGSIVLYRLMEYVFDKMKFYKMYTSVLDNNQGALNLYKKFGFREEGKLRKHVLREGEYIDVFLVGILEKEWEGVKGSLPIADFINESEELG